MNNKDIEMFEHVSAFQEMLGSGSLLLTEVLSFAQRAEASLQALETEKQALRLELEQAQVVLADTKEQARKAHLDAESLAELCGQLKLEVQGFQEKGDGAHLGLQELENRLRKAERELEETRRLLLQERARRDRAIHLIKPASGSGKVEMEVGLCAG